MANCLGDWGGIVISIKVNICSKPSLVQGQNYEAPSIVEVNRIISICLGHERDYLIVR